MDRQLFLKEVTDLMAITFRLNRSLIKDFDDFHCISPLQMQTLIAIKNGMMFNMTELAERLLMTRQQLTKVIDALVERELVVRGSDPDNRRHVMVELSKKGEEFLYKTIASHPMLSMLDDSDYQKLLDAMGMIKEILADFENRQNKEVT